MIVVINVLIFLYILESVVAAKCVPLKPRLLIIAAYANIDIAFVIGDEIKVNRSATNLTIFNVGLARIGLIDQHVEVFTAVRAFDIFLEQFQDPLSATSGVIELLFLPGT